MKHTSFARQLLTWQTMSVSVGVQLAVTARIRPSTPPLYISTNPSHVIPNKLQTLYSCPVDLNKLRIALSHSDVVVSVFAHPEVVSYYRSSSGRKISGEEGGRDCWVGNWRVGFVTASSGELVGFGRAVSDSALTASIHDVMVLPPLQGMGIGKMIVKRILRVLTSRGIYDISALCSEEERSFFTACGFGNDILESTTMMYTRTVSPGEENQTVHRVGRKQLLVPPDKKSSLK